MAALSASRVHPHDYPHDRATLRPPATRACGTGARCTGALAAMAPSPSDGTSPPPKGKKRGHQQSIEAAHSSEEKKGYLTPDQCRQLEGFGLRETQIDALRRAIATITIILQVPAVGDVKARLVGIATPMDTLARAVEPLAHPSDPATELAAKIFDMVSRLLVDDWAALLNAHSMVSTPRIDDWVALLNAHSRGIHAYLAALAKCTVHRDGDPWLVEMIDVAMRRNWPTGEPYPRKLNPSVSVTSRFYKIVDICFEAAGYSDHPKRALEAYVQQWRALQKSGAIISRPDLSEGLRADVTEAWARQMIFEIIFPGTPPKT